MSAIERSLISRHNGSPMSESQHVTLDTLPFSFACPQCRGLLERGGPNTLICPRDGRSFRRIEGIWRMMTPERQAYFRVFLHEYDTVRQAEGRGSTDPHYYQTLPFKDLTGRLAADWRIRAKSFELLIERVIQPLEGRSPRPLKILDVGAGNGWLSNRLAARGHQLAAVDLRTDAFDGLGARRHYETTFTTVQAEFDRLPFDSERADLVIFNASIHYSTDYLATLREALRVLKPLGRLVIIDSPVYRDPQSGEAMVREREAQFDERFGFPSNAIPSESYLTFDRLDDLASTLGLRWRVSEPFYGLAWAMRPWKAKLRRHREPARFLVIDGRREVLSSKTGPFQRAVGRRLSRWRYRLTQRHRYNRLVMENVARHSILVLPQVFNPRLFRTGEFLAGLLDDQLIPPGSTILDMGSGSGAAGVVAATWAHRVVAVDINPEAVRCTRINALLNGVENKIEAREGDLFAPVHGERFDVVLFNPPYFRGTPQDAIDHAWRSNDTVERFAAGLSDHLAPKGRALVVLSTDGDCGSFLDSFRANGLAIAVVARRKLLNETLTVYRLSAEE